MHLCRRDADKRGNLATQIEQRVQLDGMLGRLETCPGEQRHAEIDRGRIQGVNGVGQFDAKIVVDVQSPCFVDQQLCEVGVNAPIARLVGIG